MSERWILLSDGARPTEDIYFLESVAPYFREKGKDAGRLAVGGWRWRVSRWILSRQLGANLVLCRTLPLVVLRWLERERSRFGKIIYLIDDDLGAAADDPALPVTYRQRMYRAAERQPRLLKLADVVIASSDLLAQVLSEKHAKVHVMNPPLIASLPSLDHFVAGKNIVENRGERRWKVGFLGTRSHLMDLEHISPALQELQHYRSDTELEIMLGSNTPKQLAALPRVNCSTPLKWKAFRHYQSTHRIHIGLAPLLDTPFNRGKSWIKFLDIAAMGGVGIFSRRHPYTDIVEDGVDGLLADDDPADWLHCLNFLLDNPEQAQCMARAAARSARDKASPRGAADDWGQIAETSSASSFKHSG